ncbi:MAG TPA: polyprenyl diphosphate synthase [Nitriliruptorales bacterium]|nr:polyprenyl diphosphate synthase [Nitriliruptorales bacterium]
MARPSDLVYRLYERRLAGQVTAAPLPRHVGVILDGNRRFARERGMDDPNLGHLAGARKIEEFLDWCWELGVQHVTLWLLSTDNLDRDATEVSGLLRIIEDTVLRIAHHPKARERRLRVIALGALDLLPEETRRALKEADEATAGHDQFFLQVAVGYGGRREITDALRSLLWAKAAEGATLERVAETLQPEDIGDHLYTTGPDPDLIIRTSGELRLSGFLLWQSAHSEFYFCDPYWPDFRRIDFLRALREFQHRQRRYGR